MDTNGLSMLPTGLPDGCIIPIGEPAPPPSKKKTRRGGGSSTQKRRCISTACMACRKRKSKCNGVTPSCGACSSVYGTACVYDPNSDLRRKGVYREKIDSMKAPISTLQVLIEAILNAPEDEVLDVVRKIRACDNLDVVADSLSKQDYGHLGGDESEAVEPDYTAPLDGERDLARKMGELRLENGSVRFIGGTSHLIYLGAPPSTNPEPESNEFDTAMEPMTSWSDVTKDTGLVIHLMNLYFTWHYPYFTTLSKNLFYRDYFRGKPQGAPLKTTYCSPLLVNAMLALGCHFSDVEGAYGTPDDSWTKGDHFFAECKRLIIDNDEYEIPRLTTVQALVLMSVREAGCGREAKGWVYSGMSFRMAQDLGLNLDVGSISTEISQGLDDLEIDARRVTFWGCFLFDKCWSNYLGRLPQLPKHSYNVPKYDVFPDEDAEDWSPYTDKGSDISSAQPSRTRAIGLQLSKLCEISSDLLLFFYHPNHLGSSGGKSVELKKLSELHRRLENWRKELPAELEPREGQLPNAILMHMFFHLQYIHLFRPFLKYAPSRSPLPPHVSPRRICTANASAISKLMRLYKKLYNLRQICNIAVYMIHSACCIHLLNLPEKTAKRDVIHSVKHLEEIAEDWLCGRRAMSIISVLARKWKVDLPEEAAHVLQRTDERWGTFSTSDVPTPRSQLNASPSPREIVSAPLMIQQEEHQKAASFGVQRGPSSGPAAISGNVMPRDMANNFMQTSGSFSTANLATISNAAVMENSLPMGVVSVGPLEGSVWPQPEAVRPTLNFDQTFMSMNGNTGSNQTSCDGSEDTTPSSAYAVDGQAWCLRDGVNWQSGFDAWNGDSNANRLNLQAAADPPVFTFGSNTDNPLARRSSPAANLDYDSLGNLPSEIDGWYSSLAGLD